MFEIFNKFDRDNTFCSWLKAIYSNSMSKVKNEWYTVKKIHNTKKQAGIPSLLFAIYIELLAVAVRQYVENIKT